MTLGCGSWGGNVTSDNISPRHLLDVKRIAFETRPINPPSTDGRLAATSDMAGYPQPAQRSHVDVTAIEALVDQFLAERDGGRRKQSSESAEQHEPMTAAPAFTRAGQTSSPANQPSPPATILDAEASVAPALSNGHILDFVCEDDVKRAITSREKIYINSKTIITPAARDLGEEHDIFSRNP